MRADFAVRAVDRRPQWAGLALLVASGALLAYSGYRAWAATRDIDQARASVQRLRADAQDQARILRDLATRQKNRDEELGRMAVQTLAAPPQRLISDLQPVVPAGARLEGLILTYGGEAVQLEIRLLTRTPEVYDQFLARIEDSGRFTDLSFGTENRSGEMKVTVRALYRPGGQR